MGMDTSGSDHDLLLKIKDGDEGMVQLLYEVVQDLQSSGQSVRLQRATAAKKDFAVGITGYYRDKEFDLVPYTNRPGKEGEFQWDVQRQVWQPILHKDLAPKLQQLSEQHPEGFLIIRLLKLWNEDLPKIRSGSSGGKAPLISVHIPLLVLAARDSGQLDAQDKPQGYLLASLRFIERNWRRAELLEVTLQEVQASPHLERITAKYGAMDGFPGLVRESIRVLEEACAERGLDKAAAERVISSAGALFGPAGRSKL